MDEVLYRIIHSAKRGDKEAFAELVKRYKGQVYRHAAGMLSDRTEAEDVSQEAFIKAFYAFAKLDNEHAFSSWLIQIVSNLCKDRLKRRGRDPVSTYEFNEKNATVGFENQHVKLSIEEAMKRLSPDHREVILLHDVHGYRYDEIAEITGVPLGTVKSRLFSARMAMRNEMKKGDE